MDYSSKQGYPSSAPPPQTDAPPYPHGAAITMQPQSPEQPTIILVGGCPSCGKGVLQDDYGCCGICLAICCFPVGVVCCLLMKQQRCSNCGKIYGN